MSSVDSPPIRLRRDATGLSSVFGSGISWGMKGNNRKSCERAQAQGVVRARRWSSDGAWCVVRVCFKLSSDQCAIRNVLEDVAICPTRDSLGSSSSPDFGFDGLPNCRLSSSGSSSPSDKSAQSFVTRGSVRVVSPDMVQGVSEVFV